MAAKIGEQYLFDQKDLETFAGVIAQKVKQEPRLFLLDRGGVAKLFKKSITCIDNYRKRKVNPLPMHGHPPMIEEAAAWEWYKDHSGDYQGI